MVRADEDRFLERYNYAGRLVGMSVAVIAAMMVAFFIGRAAEGKVHAMALAEQQSLPAEVTFRRDIFSPDGTRALRIYPDDPGGAYEQHAYYAIWSEEDQYDLVIIPKINVLSTRHPGQTEVFWQGNKDVHVLVPDGALSRVDSSKPMKRAGINVHFHKGHPDVLLPFREKLLKKIHGGEPRGGR